MTTKTQDSKQKAFPYGREYEEKKHLYTRAAFSSLHERLIQEDEGFWPPYKIDVERIIHSKAFARYTDKTQVVYLVQNDHVTHRSLHVQAVSSFARGLAQMLNLNVNLVEAISLGHDVGHPPFGHEGEGYLSKLSVEHGLGAFSHAHQSCRLLREIEPLNLGLAVYDGFLCHDGGMKQSSCKPVFDKTIEDHFDECRARTVEPEKDLSPKTLEGALVKMCDTISYLAKDIEDGIHIGFITRQDLPHTILGKSLEDILTKAAQDLLTQSFGKDEITLSDDVFDALKKLRKFNFERIYMHPSLKVESQKISASYRLLFETLLQDAEQNQENSHLHKHFLHSKNAPYVEKLSLAQKVIDYIAGMTDNYFIHTLEKLIIPQKINL
jgi:dGTPase